MDPGGPHAKMTPIDHTCSSKMIEMQYLLCQFGVPLQDQLMVALMPLRMAACSGTFLQPLQCKKLVLPEICHHQGRALWEPLEEYLTRKRAVLTTLQQET